MKMEVLFEKIYGVSRGNKKPEAHTAPVKPKKSTETNGVIDADYKGDEYQLDVDASVDEADLKNGRPYDEFHVDEINDGVKFEDSDDTEGTELSSKEKKELVDDPEFQDAVSDDVHSMFVDQWAEEQEMFDNVFDEWAQQNVLSGKYEDNRFAED